MAKNYYEPEIKKKAVQLYLTGESSYKIAKDLVLPYPNLVRKWAQAWIKKNGLSATDYRKERIGDEADEIRLRNIIQRREEERAVAIKAVLLILNGKVKNWTEALTEIQNTQTVKIPEDAGSKW